MYTVDQIVMNTWVLVSSLILADVVLMWMLLYIIKTYFEFNDIVNKRFCQYAIFYVSVCIVLITIMIGFITSCWTNYSEMCRVYLF